MSEPRIRDIQRSLGSSAPQLLSSTRRFIRDAQVVKMSKQTNERHLFLFNDMIVFAKPKKNLGTVTAQIAALLCAALTVL
jgi:hypothetical protein